MNSIKRLNSKMGMLEEFSMQRSEEQMYEQHRRSVSRQQQQQKAQQQQQAQQLRQQAQQRQNMRQSQRQQQQQRQQQSLESTQILEKDEDEELAQIQEEDSGPQNRLKSVIIFVFNVLMFFPNLVVLQPLLKLWLFITFPLRFLEERASKMKAEVPVPQSPSSSPSGNSSTSGAGAITNSAKKPNEYNDLFTINSLTTNNSIPYTEINSLKSPSSSGSIAMFSRLPKVIFYPLNFNPMKHQKKVLILDLDETLIHSLSKSNRMSTAHMVEVKLKNNLATLYYVYKRPYCDKFLTLVSKWFDVYIFTASAKEYADPVINWLERDTKFFCKRYYRDDCTLRKGAGYIKDLSTLNVDLSKVILVDNSPVSYSLNYENAIDIEGWIDDPTDCELLQLLPLLNSLRFVTDVRYILGLKSGEESFRK